MGLFDGLKQALGLKAEADATRDADPDDLWGMSTAYVTMEADLDYVPTGDAALCFAAVDSTDFTDALENVEAILQAGEAETGTTAEFVEDGHGYHWVVLGDDTFEDLVTSIHFAADELIEQGYGSRLLAALFAFDHPTEDRSVYWVYSFRRGAYYPFAPLPGERERDSSAEFKLQSVLDGELDLEDDEAYWYPLWPEGDGHPWE
ncbi:PspA-associated protein PspAB [Halapricum desulfuricans]|uniref:Uncharacterized protein n=1 Tax=Halapricum desulfuricans TaxID=2841257 RepID=A0A897MZI9_9EURY|nr:hypothetical protein [Halapricum desulfuricans]QSG04513.1 Uncharacterized protein HSR121_0154 [Halapricum desulfuricans]